MDRDWRAFERQLQANPDDQDLLVRATIACERSGRRPPEWLQLRRLYPPLRFDASVPLSVWILDADGVPRGLGRTPGDPPLDLPIHRAWWVQPEHGARPRDLAEALAGQPRPGVALPPSVADPRPWLDGLPGLIRLDLGGCARLTDEGLDAVASQGGLTWLSLWYCAGVSDAGLARLADLGGLESLDLSHCGRLTPAGLRGLARLERLAALRLRHLPGVDDAVLGALGELPGLIALDLRGCQGITAAGLAALARLPHLTILNLAGCRGLGDDALAALRELGSVRELTLVGCGEALAREAPRALSGCRVVA